MRLQFKGRLIIEGFPEIYQDYEAWKEVIALNARIEEIIHLKYYDDDEELLYHRAEEYTKRKSEQDNGAVLGGVKQPEYLVFQKI